MVLEKILESPLGSKEMQSVNPKENQSWRFIGRTDAETETPILGHLMWSTDSFEKTLMLAKIEVRRKRNDRGWDGWMASPIWWTLIWASSRSWWWTEKPGVLQSKGRKESVTMSHWTELIQVYIFFHYFQNFQPSLLFCSIFSSSSSLSKIPIVHRLNGIRYPISAWGSVILSPYFMFYY